jgi:hypothetical protein
LNPPDGAHGHDANRRRAVVDARHEKAQSFLVGELRGRHSVTTRRKLGEDRHGAETDVRVRILERAAERAEPAVDGEP